MSVAVLEFMVGFFDRVYMLHSAESIMLIYWDKLRQRYTFRVPEQEETVWRSSSGFRSAMDVTYEVPLDTAAHQLLVADCHCHGDLGAGPSFTDERDDKYRDGVHAIVRRIDGEPPEMSIIISIDGFRFRMRFDKIFSGYRRRRRIVPARWLERVRVKVDCSRYNWAATSQDSTSHT